MHSNRTDIELCFCELSGAAPFQVQTVLELKEGPTEVFNIYCRMCGDTTGFFWTGQAAVDDWNKRKHP